MVDSTLRYFHRKQELVDLTSEELRRSARAYVSTYQYDRPGKPGMDPQVRRDSLNAIQSIFRDRGETL